MGLTATNQNPTTELIPLTTTDAGVQAVTGRDLHQFLGVKSNYTNWFERMTGYGFVAGQDYMEEKMPSTGGRPGINHVMALPMAIRVSGYARTYNGERAVAYLTEGKIMPRKEVHTPESSVYFIYAPAVKMVKIGTSINVKRRIRTLKTMSPTDLHLLATEGGGTIREAALHSMFAEHHSHGEWFHMVPEIEDHIAHLATGKTPAQDVAA